MQIPGTVHAGDSLTWDDGPSSDNLGNTIDSATWTLKYAFQQSGTTNLSVTATAEGSGWRTTLTKAQTAAWSPSYKVFWQAYAESGSDRVTLGQGYLTIKPNVTTATTSTELRSQTQQDLEAVQAAMRAIISGGAVAEYSIGGRSLRKVPMADLIALETHLKARLAREQKADRIANGLGNPDNVFVRFRR